MHAAEPAIALAGQLRSLTDDELTGLIRERAVPTASIVDFLDLAEALLEPESVQQALERLDRDTLGALAVLTETGAATAGELAARLAGLGADETRIPHRLDAARRLALAVERDGLHAVPGAVAAVLAGWPSRGLPGLPELLEPPPGGPEPVDDLASTQRDPAAAEAAFATTGRIAELLLELERSPVRELARGGIALPDAKRLAETATASLDQVEQLLGIAEGAGLLLRGGGLVVPGVLARDWLNSEPARRWLALASGWLERLPGRLQEVLAQRARLPWGARMIEAVSWLFPADTGIRERAERAAAQAAALGIVVGTLPSTPGSALLSGEPERAVAALAALLPASVDRAYLQHDLSIVSPGPLRADLDLRLRTIAEAEGPALAARYRVSAASLARALAEGETAGSIRSFLAALSLTGLPQPLEYLIAEAAERYGLVRVRGTADSTIVHSPDSALLATIAVDSALSALGFIDDEGALHSRAEAEVVLWALAEARYPAALEDEGGRLLPPSRHRRPADRDALDVEDSAAAVVERLRVTEPVDEQAARAAWLARQLEAAARSRQAVLVTVRLPDDSPAQYLLEPSSLSAGRLRARDRERGLERTLPLASIEAVEPAPPAG